MATFYNAEGAEYSTDDPGEVNRLRLSRSHYSKPPGELSQAELLGLDQGGFHPETVGVDEVKAKLDEVGRDTPAGRKILAEERGGKARKTVLGDESEGAN